MASFVALVSGGKDSIYSVMECIAHGYKLEALVNLSPPRNQQCAPEIDSYMYQSVATENVPLIAQALDVPLYQFPIVGSAVCRKLHYSIEVMDEVEDLFNALSQVKSELPTIQFVSSGAILSDYQRIRVEHVASRLSLRSLAFLWQRPTRQLLRDMLSSSLDAVIVKIAGYGLRTDKHLGARLADIEDDLLALSKPPWSLNVCGEGGEYESFTIDCPLFRHRLRILSPFDVVTHSEDGFTAVAYLHLKNIMLEAKSCEPIRDCSELLSITGSPARPFLSPVQRLNDLPRTFLEELRKDLELHNSIVADASSCSSDVCARERFHRGSFPVISSFGFATLLEDMTGAVVESANQAMIQLQASLALKNMTTDHVIHYLVLINQPLTDVVLNALDSVFVSVFGMPWETNDTASGRLFPPTRVCIGAHAVSLPHPTAFLDNSMAVTIHLVVTLHSSLSGHLAPLCGGSHGLHVQSISHWAPASVGPYSQAIRVTVNPEINGVTDDQDGAPLQVTTFFSGQVGLIPETSALPIASDMGCDEQTALETQCWLALRHCQRLLKALSSAVWNDLYLAVCYATSTTFLRFAKQTFHTGVCLNWLGLCVCDSRVLWCTVPTLPKAASVEWQIVARTVFGATEIPPIQFVLFDANETTLIGSSMSNAWLLFCPRSCPLSCLSPGHPPVITVTELLDRTDCVAYVFL